MGLSGKSGRSAKNEDTPGDAKVAEWLVDDETTKVEKWRIHVLAEAGYPKGEAQRLAMSAVDLHEAVALVRNGCDPETAAEILL